MMERHKIDLVRVSPQERKELLRIVSGVACTWLCQDCVFFIGNEVGLENDQSGIDTNCALMLFELALNIGYRSSERNV
jgi:hypothetical protein